MQCSYDTDGKLVSNFDYSDPPMIFECNDACACNKLRCVNRCLDRGARVSLKVFRQKENTARGGGWGVSALQPITKGSLVSEYLGEILPGSLANHREDDSYLFALEMKDDILEVNR
jgi:[histone H3]-lysine9 N-trimethyltransferase EHMT